MSERFWQWVVTHSRLVAKMLFGFVTAVLAAISVWVFCLDGGGRRKEYGKTLPSAHVDVRTHISADGKSVAETTALNMKVSELEAGRDSLLRTVESLGVKNRRLLALAQAAARTSAKLEAPVRDSVVHLPGKTDTLPGRMDTLRCLRWADAWLSLDGCIRADTFEGSVVSRDTLDIIAHRVPRRFLFFRYGCRAVRLDVVSHNPHAVVTAARYIRLQE